VKLTFHGGARTVTGSRHLLEVNGHRLLLDCGLFQGRREESNRLNRDLPAALRGADAVVLSHAHIDHSGALPSLVKGGFRGPIHATAASADLCRLMLLDSAHIQEKDAAWLARRERRLVEPLYGAQDAEQTAERMQPHDYGAGFEAVPGVRVTFYDAGHILGSALVQLDLQEGSRHRRLLFTGDLGRPFLPILRDPVQLDGCDFYLSESTYGDLARDERVSLTERVQPIFARLLERRAKVLIPAFSVGRTQEVVYVLSELARAGRLPRVPVYVDSPLAREATRVYERHPECFDAEMRALVASANDPLGWKDVHYVESVEESMALNDREGPCVIVAASGMCEAGRILHHLRHGVEEPRNAVLMVGYQAEHTLGRKLLEGHDPVNILGEPFHPRAEVAAVDAFSAHADGNQLLGYAARFKHRPRRIFLVHGELEKQQVLADRLRAEAGYPRVDIPDRGESVELD
jgi:metallo-beta-lactamase family protein